MKNKGITVIIVLLAIILAGMIGLLVYLELGQREAQTPNSPETQTQGTAAETEGTEAPVGPTFETQGEEDATPMVPVADPEMDPAGATEGPAVDPNLGEGETRDPDENELPIVG